MTEHEKPREWLIWRRSNTEVGADGPLIPAGGKSIRVVEAEPVERELKRLRAALAAREEPLNDRFHAALVEIDTYLANDPQVWRIVSVAKAGDVLCDVLGAEEIQRINRGVMANLCVACQTELPVREDTEQEECECRFDDPEPCAKCSREMAAREDTERPDPPR